MSTRANRTLCAVRTFILTPPICSARLCTTHLSFPTPQSDSHTLGPSGKNYHSDAVAYFRSIRLHGRKSTNIVPHVFKATAKASEEHNHMASAGTHNNAPDASLLLPLQLGVSDADTIPETAAQNQSTHFMRPDNKEAELIGVGHNESKAHGIPLSYPARRQGEIRIDFQDMSSNSNHKQKMSVADEFLDLQADAPLVGVQDRAPVANARQASSNRDKPTIQKITRELLNAARVGDLQHAYKLYLEFIRLGKLDVEIADVLISALCSGTLQAPSPVRISQALQVYSNLDETESQIVDGNKGFFDSRNLSNIAEQEVYSRIYHTLLRALSAPLSATSSARNVGPEVREQYTKASLEILAAMKARGLVPDSRTACSFILLQFSSATSHEEAFEFCTSLVTELEAARAQGSTASASDSKSQQMSRILSPSLLDLRGYRMVLNAFARLSFPTAPVAPGPLWFAIAQDMRKRGYAVTVEDYTIYLGAIMAQTTSPFTLQRTAIGLASSRDEEARMNSMMACVKYVHKRLALDVTLDPDAMLMNTLMNVYQYLGAFDMALGVFNVMWVSGRMDDVTPVIIFDACGHAKRPREATTIWRKLVEKGWQFDKHTLDTWVECLCRLGNVEAACKFVCMYMGRDKAGYSSKGDTRPDVQTCLILLKLSWVVGQNLGVKEKIRTHLPHIWKKLTTHYT